MAKKITAQDLTAPHPRQAEIDAINAARNAAGFRPIGNTEDATIDAALQHGQTEGYFTPAAAPGAPAITAPTTEQSAAPTPVETGMQGGITNKGQNTSVTTETTDVSGVQDATMKMVKAMQDEGLTYSQAFEKFYPQPTRNTNTEADIRRRQKLATFSDMLRLAAEGIGAAKGATVQRRDQSQPHAGLAAKLAQEYATYSANLNEWQKKGVEAVMKDIQTAQDLHAKNLANAPKTRRTVEDNQWDREKFETQQAFDEKKLAQDKALADKDRAAANYRASVSAGGSQPKQIEIVFADNNGTAVIDDRAADSLYNAAYRAMLDDPSFMNSGNKDAKQIEAINNDYTPEGKASKIKVYVDQHAHESPKALELIRDKSVKYTRSDKPSQDKQATGGGKAPWLVVPEPKQKSNKAPWVK